MSTIVESSQSLAGYTFADRYRSDTFAVFNAALAPATTVIRVAAGVNVDEPIVVLNVSNSTASFSRTQIELGARRERDDRRVLRRRCRRTRRAAQ